MSILGYYWGNSFINIKVLQKKQGHLIIATLLIILPYLNMIKNALTLGTEILCTGLLLIISILYLVKTNFFKLDITYEN